MEKKVVKKATKVTTKKKEEKIDGDLVKSIKLFNIYFFGYMAYSLAFLAAGIVLLTNPAMATDTAGIITASVLIFVGFGNGFSYAMKNKIRIFDFNIIYALSSLILAALIIINPFEMFHFLSIAFGIFLIVSGMLKYNFALNFKFIGEESWKLILTMSILSLLFGVILIIVPFANLYFTQVVGLFMFIYGVIEMAHSILLKQRSKEFLKLLK